MSKDNRVRKRLPQDPTTPAPRATKPSSTAPSPDLSGQRFGDFQILRRLGQGGMGQVYLAEQISLKRKIAIKVLREDIAANPTAIERFKIESKNVAQLSHANIVQVHMIGEHAGRHFMVLEYVEGKSLGEYVARKGPLEVPLVISIMRQVAGALNRASEMGIVHRDIKPENILLNRKGEAKVADFGLSRCLDHAVELTRTGAAVGTPVYMSPEQVEGKPVDQRSDIYSFGVTCYQMLAGHAPFEGSNAFEIALKHVREEPAPLEEIRSDIPPALCAIVSRMMAKKPKARYQSARELRDDIIRVRDSLSGGATAMPVDSIIVEPIAAGRTMELEEVPAWWLPLLRRWWPGLVALGLLSVLFLTFTILWLLRPPRPDVGGTSGLPVVPVAGVEDKEESLKKVVEQSLRDNSPNPGGVDACLELAVLYLNQNKYAEAEELFKRMDERRSNSAYHVLGRLGLAITDALKDDDPASHSKFKELFDFRNRENRTMINNYLAKNPEFEKWVNEADFHNVRNGGGAFPQGKQIWGKGFPGGKSPFKR